MSKSKLITYYLGFSSHLKFDEAKENLEKDVSTLKPLNNLILDDLDKSDEDFEIRNCYLGWCSIFLHVINNQKCELWNLCYNSICKIKLTQTNCKLTDPFDLKSLECNNRETYLICNDRKVKGWPKNNFKDELIEIKDLMDVSGRKSRVKQISVGNSFVCSLLESGIVRMINEEGSSIEFKLDNDEFDCVSCGLEFLLLLSKKGQVYAYGSNSKGQLGISCLEDVTDDCKLIETFEGLKVTQISTGGWHSLVLEGGNVYSFGWNDVGQLGIDKDASSPHSGIVDTPTLVNLPSYLDFIMVKCGSRHSAAISSKGLLWVWGWNKYSQCGLNVIDFKEIRIPKKIRFKG